MNALQVFYFDVRHSLEDPQLNAPDGFVRVSDVERLREEIDARCDRAYCDGADAALVIVSASVEEAAKWKAAGYSGRRADSRKALCRGEP